RHHAALALHESRLDVRDLGSCNGTFLNGMRLNAHHPYQVKHGDEIRCGQMVMRLFFQEQRTP
ncbi:MAG: FHA domain-containing protein, partial [Burkholderiales bacterium]|nr:FHA domain-containing protein [Anaerolineae bacterium]